MPINPGPGSRPKHPLANSIPHPLVPIRMDSNSASSSTATPTARDHPVASPFDLSYLYADERGSLVLPRGIGIPRDGEYPMRGRLTPSLPGFHAQSPGAYSPYYNRHHQEHPLPEDAPSMAASAQENPMLYRIPSSMLGLNSPGSSSESRPRKPPAPIARSLPGMYHHYQYHYHE